jgi:hypothetical protein
MTLQEQVVGMGWENMTRNDVANEVRAWDFTIFQNPRNIRNWYPAYRCGNPAIYYNWYAYYFSIFVTKCCFAGMMLQPTSRVGITLDFAKYLVFEML